MGNAMAEKLRKLSELETFEDEKPATTEGGIKHDNDKPRMELITTEFMEALAEVLTTGAVKYEDRNWERGLKYSRVFGAAMRHLWAWWDRRNLDDETGLSHLAHAACCVMFLLTYERRGMGGFDDRS